MRYSEQFMEHIEYAFNAFCKIVLRHEAINAWRDLKPQYCGTTPLTSNICLCIRGISMTIHRTG